MHTPESNCKLQSKHIRFKKFLECELYESYFDRFTKHTSFCPSFNVKNVFGWKLMYAPKNNCKLQLKHVRFKNVLRV